MDNNNNNQNPGNQNASGGTRTVLKKVKRPINRMMPQTPQNASSTQSESSGQTEAFTQSSATQTSQNKTFNAETASAPRNLSDNPFVRKQPQPFRNSTSSLANEETITEENNIEPVSAISDDAFNLDSYLDGDDTLPSLGNRAPDTRRFNDTPQFIEEETEEPEYQYNNSGLPPYLTKKVLVLLGALFFFLGILTSKVLFTEQKIVRNGLQGVVINPEVPRGRARCGVAEKTQGCVLYLMNPQRQELNARDFYDLASQLTGRQRFVIETGNMRYSNTKIRPGDIAQLNIPPL